MFYWPMDTGRIPSEYDLSFIQENDREAVRLLLKQVEEYLRLPAIIDSYDTDEEKGNFIDKYKNIGNDPVYKMYLRNCLLPDRITNASSSIDGIAYNYCQDDGERKIEIEKARERMNETIKPMGQEETLEKVAKFRDLTFEALRLFVKKKEG